MPSPRNQLSGRAAGHRKGVAGTRVRAGVARLLILLTIAAPLSESARAQPQAGEAGRQLAQAFSPRDYGADPYVWYAAQGNGGLMYFANLDGVLEFDGRTWRTIPAGGTIIRSVAADASGRIFVGSRGNLGFLEADSVGTLSFVSLRDRIPEQDRDFEDVWQLLSTKEGIYFCTPTHIFRWTNDERMHVWRGSFHKAFAVRDTVYVKEWDHGLVRLSKDGIIPLPGGERFVTTSATAMLPFGDDRILIAGHTGGLFLFDGTSITPFQTEADRYLREHPPSNYAFAELPDGTYALGTRDGGVVLLDREGRMLSVADRRIGLRSDRVYFIHVDHEGGLWLCHENGISRWEAAAPVSYFDESSGLTGNVEAFLRHDGKLYAATSSGVSVLTPAAEPGRPARFVLLEGDRSQCWDLASVDSRLLAGCTKGIYEVAGETLLAVMSTEAPIFDMHPSNRDPALVYLGLKDGLARIRIDGAGAIEWESVDEVRIEVRSIVEDPDGTLWIGGGTTALRIDPAARPERMIHRFGRESGLSRGYVDVAAVGNEIILIAENGLWHASRQTNELRRLSSPFAASGGQEPSMANGTLAALAAAADGRTVHGLQEDQSGNIWLWSSEGPGMLRRGEDEFTWEPLAVLEGWDVAAVFLDAGGRVWMGGSEGVARFDPGGGSRSETPFDAMVRRVATINTDSLLFGGAIGRKEPVALNYADNAVRFSVGTASFDRRPLQPAAQQFQYFLDGFDRNWSAWSDEAHKDYTNIPEGEYEFRVRARGAHGRLSRVAGFSFSILPPWYRTPWAYLGYVLLGVGLVYGATRWRMARLKRLNRMLTRQVEERSAQLEQRKQELEDINVRLAEHEKELESRNQMLEQQTERLRDLDAVKSRFFANISHEFRTPLTLILGPLQDALNESDEQAPDRIAQHIEPMHRNASRLLGLINQLLDLTRLESGKMTLRARRIDLVAFLKNVAAAFGSRAMRKEIDFELDAPSAPLHVYADEEKLERVLVNLISNAFKFTPAGGSIWVRCRLDEAADPGEAEIRVEDTGSGIPPEPLGRIFDRFYTVDASTTRANEGTGIGLALARELIDLHGGTIAVESEVGTGTTFIIRIPVGTQHLDAGDVMPSEPALKTHLAAQGASSVVTDKDAWTSPLPRDEADHDAPVVPPTHPSPGDTRASVLMVEDNPDLRDYLRSHLEGDYRVYEAVDGVEGLAMTKEIRPDLVISDVMMPRMDGYALCDAIKTDGEIDHIPVVLLTAKASDEDRVEGLKTGADDYLFKPFNKDELLVRVENLIQIRRLLRRRFGSEVIAVKASEIEVESEDAAFVEEATAVVEAHAGDANFGVDWLADEVGMSVRQLQRRLKDLTGLTPSGFIRAIRLQRAAQLIEQGAGNVSEIAMQVGFNDPKHFSKLFRQIFGTAPSQYPQESA